MSLSKVWEILKDREVWHAAIHGVTKGSDTTEWLNNNSNLCLHVPHQAGALKSKRVSVLSLYHPGNSLGKGASPQESGLPHVSHHTEMPSVPEYLPLITQDVNMTVPVKLLGSETILGSDPGRLSWSWWDSQGILERDSYQGWECPQNKLGNSRGNIKGSLQRLLLLLVRGKPDILLRPSFHAHDSESISPRDNLTPFSIRKEEMQCGVGGQR